MILAGACSFWLINDKARGEQGNYWVPAEPIRFHFQNLGLIRSKLPVFFSGSYYLNDDFNAGVINGISGQIWMWVFALLIVIQLYRINSRNFNKYSHLLCISTLLSFVIFFLDDPSNFQYRYLLPITVPLFLWFSVEFYQLFKIINARLIPYLIFTTFGEQCSCGISRP